MSGYFFVSYSSKDKDRVWYIVDYLRSAGIRIWSDTGLIPGSQWMHEIESAIENAAGVITFISANSVDSEWVSREISYAVLRGAHIYPVLIEPKPSRLPFELANIQYIDLTDPSDSDKALAHMIAVLNTQQQVGQSGVGLQHNEIREIAQEAVSQIRRRPILDNLSIPKSVFIVHGHDKPLRELVEKYLLELSVQPVVLSKMENQHKSLFEKFLAWSEETRFAVVLLSADDMGAGRYQFDEPDVGLQALQFRARQNVILELGFFYGYLGWENVFVLYKKPQKVFPNFERPSDLDGVLFEEVDESENWKQYLRERLEQAGFQLK